MISRPLANTLSLVLLALGVGLIALLLHVNQHIQQQMENNVEGIDMVVGAKGSPLQLILSAVYHIDAPTGNISLNEAERLRKNPLVAQGIPLSYGDNYNGYRIVGTNHNYPALYEAALSEGQLWQKAFEVTVGYQVASKLNLKVGDTFAGSHGLTQGGEAHGTHAYQVVGIFEYTNSVVDQLILTATESVWEVHNHEEGDHDEHEADGHDGHEEESHEAHGQEAHETDKEITAMLVKFRNPIGMVQLPRMVNENTNMQAAVPVYEISRLFGLLGVGVNTLSTIALVIMAVSALSVFISLFSALKDRQYEMALMRTHGATRWQLVWLVMQEGLLITLLGFVLGILLSRLGLWLMSGLMEESYHYTLSAWTLGVNEGWLLLISMAIGVLAALLPAIRVFNLNISRTLANA